MAAEMPTACEPAHRSGSWAPARKLAAHDEAETSITYIALAGFLLTTVPLPFVWQTPASGFDCLVFLSLGLFGGFGHYFMVRAFELAPAPFVSPFNYGQLIGATLLSVVVFGQLPDVWVWAGALVIAGSGVLMLFAERHARSQSQTHSLEGCPTRHRTVSVVHEAEPGGTHSGWALYRLADPLWRTDLVVIRWCLLRRSAARPKRLGEQDYASLFHPRSRAHSPRRDTSRGAPPNP